MAKLKYDPNDTAAVQARWRMLHRIIQEAWERGVLPDHPDIQLCPGEYPGQRVVRLWDPDWPADWKLAPPRCEPGDLVNSMPPLMSDAEIEAWDRRKRADWEARRLKCIALLRKKLQQKTVRLQDAALLRQVEKMDRPRW